jgi:hypothetical protein
MAWFVFSLYQWWLFFKLVCIRHPSGQFVFSFSVLCVCVCEWLNRLLVNSTGGLSVNNKREKRTYTGGGRCRLLAGHETTCGSSVYIQWLPSSILLQFLAIYFKQKHVVHQRKTKYNIFLSLCSKLTQRPVTPPSTFARPRRDVNYTSRFNQLLYIGLIFECVAIIREWLNTLADHLIFRKKQKTKERTISSQRAKKRETLLMISIDERVGATPT